MTVAMIKTKAEQALTEAFEALSDRLPGGAAVLEARKQALGRFAAVGLPHRRIEEWKYTDLRNQMKEALAPAIGDETVVSMGDLFVALGPLAQLESPRVVFVNGSYRKELSSLDGLNGVEVLPLGQSLASAPDHAAEGLARVEREGSGVVALNTAYMTDGAVVRVAAKAKVAKPLLLVFMRAGSEGRHVATRNVVSVGKGAAVTLVEAFVGLAGATAEGQNNTLSEIVVGDGANVSHVKCVADMGKVTHLSSSIVDLGKDSVYRGFQHTQGVGLARNDIAVRYNGEGAKLDLSGSFLARAAEHVDTTLVVDHAVPHCESRELFKGVLDGEGRGIFQGKIIVRPDAQKTDGKQMAQVLMLSETSEFDSKPELEIYADDVVCGHGSTSAELDPDLIFYMRARGIPEAEARALLVRSFIGEAIDKIEHEGLHDAVMSLAVQWLEGAKG